jgi:small subunit ribosomal protein S20
MKTQLRHVARTVRSAIDEKDAKTAAATLATASRALAKAASKGVIHPNAASRKIARLSRAVHALGR